MDPGNRKDTILNCVVLFAAWMIVIATCIVDDDDTGTQVVRIAYSAQ